LKVYIVNNYLRFVDERFKMEQKKINNGVMFRIMNYCLKTVINKGGLVSGNLIRDKLAPNVDFSPAFETFKPF